MRILIVGGGRAAASAAAAAREANPEVEIVMVCTEDVLPYYRPRLSHSLGGYLDPSSILIHPEQWYMERRIETRTGTEVVALDGERGRARLDDGEELTWDALVLATGARPFVPPVAGAGRPYVFSLRSLADRDAITRAVHWGERALIIGGGVLGLEAAWALSRAGCEVTVLERGPHLLGRMLDSDSADFLARIVEGRGVIPLYEASSESIVGAGESPRDEEEPVAYVNLEDGRTVAADLVLFSTGVRSEIGLAQDLGLQCNRGVVVDDRMQTEHPNIYACGDVAELHGTVAGAWDAADRQGRVAGANAAGAEERYQPPAPSRTLMVMGTRVFSVGQVNNDAEITRTDSDPEEGVFRRIWLQDDRIRGAVLIGDVRGNEALQAAVNEKMSIDEAEADSVDSILAAVT